MWGSHFTNERSVVVPGLRTHPDARAQGPDCLPNMYRAFVPGPARDEDGGQDADGAAGDEPGRGGIENKHSTDVESTTSSSAHLYEHQPGGY